MVVHACDLCTLEVKAGHQKFIIILSYAEFEAGLCYKRL